MTPNGGIVKGNPAMFVPFLVLALGMLALFIHDKNVQGVRRARLRKGIAEVEVDQREELRMLRQLKSNVAKMHDDLKSAHDVQRAIYEQQNNLADAATKFATLQKSIAESKEAFLKTTVQYKLAAQNLADCLADFRNDTDWLEQLHEKVKKMSEKKATAAEKMHEMQLRLSQVSGRLEHLHQGVRERKQPGKKKANPTKQEASEEIKEGKKKEVDTAKTAKPAAAKTVKNVRPKAVVPKHVSGDDSEILESPEEQHAKRQEVLVKKMVTKKDQSDAENREEASSPPATERAVEGLTEAPLNESTEAPSTQAAGSEGLGVDAAKVAQPTKKAEEVATTDDKVETPASEDPPRVETLTGKIKSMLNWCIGRVMLKYGKEKGGKLLDEIVIRTNPLKGDELELAHFLYNSLASTFGETDVDSKKLLQSILGMKKWTTLMKSEGLAGTEAPPVVVPSVLSEEAKIAALVKEKNAETYNAFAKAAEENYKKIFEGLHVKKQTVVKKIIEPPSQFVTSRPRGALKFVDNDHNPRLFKQNQENDEDSPAAENVELTQKPTKRQHGWDEVLQDSSSKQG